MGRKKELRRARREAEAHPFTPPPSLAPTQPYPADGKLIQVPMYVTPGDHYRLRMLGIGLGTSLQRLGHRAWNALLASHGHPGLTPVLPGRRERKAGDEELPAADGASV